MIEGVLLQYELNRAEHYGIEPNARSEALSKLQYALRVAMRITFDGEKITQASAEYIYYNLHVVVWRAISK